MAWNLAAPYAITGRCYPSTTNVRQRWRVV